MRRLLLYSALLASVVALSGCFSAISAMKDAQDQSPKLATAFHQQMAKGDLAGIYNNADQSYRDSDTREKSDALFSAISRKLGAPLDCKPEGFNINATTSGTFLRSVCKTSFSKNATGTETFVWKKSGNQYKLSGYHIASDDLIER